MGVFCMKPYQVIAQIFFLLIILPETLYAEQPRLLEGEGVRVFFEIPLQAAANETLDLFPSVRKDLESKLGWRVNFKTTIFLVRESRTFQNMVGTDLVVAVALPKKNLILIDYSKMKIHPFTIESTLKHELCHLLLHDQIQSGNLPRWLDEGIAQWVAGGIGEFIMTRKKSVFQGAVLAGRLIEIRTLSRGFPGNPQSLHLAYEESKSLLEHIIDQYGVEGVLAILKSLREGTEWEKAIERGLSKPLDTLLEEWHFQLNKRITWFTYLSHHLYEILFFMAALMMIYGFIKAYRKKRAYIVGAKPHEPE